MRDWRQMSMVEVATWFSEFCRTIRTKGSRELGIDKRHYLLAMAYGVQQAIYCGYDRLAVAEFGVYTGAGLLEMCRCAGIFRDEFGLDIHIYGFDAGTGMGLPALSGDYRDQPELYQAGLHRMPDQEALRAKLPDNCDLITGDVGDTVRDFHLRLDGRVVAFAAYDLDLYSSTTRALPFLTYQPETYLPAVPLFFDDNNKTITQCEWTGEDLAIQEFNAANPMRKIERKNQARWWIMNFFVLHVLDHPIRQGTARSRFALGLHPI
jgi:hypothetical protein